MRDAVRSFLLSLLFSFFFSYVRLTAVFAVITIARLAKADADSSATVILIAFGFGLSIFVLV